MAERTRGPAEARPGQGTGDGAAVMRGRIKEQSKTALRLAEKRGRLKQLARRHERLGQAGDAAADPTAAASPEK